MSVIAVYEDLKSNAGESFGDKKITRKYTRVFRVIVDSLADTAITVKAATPVRLFQVHPGDFGAWCKEITAERDEGFTWLVSANYDTETVTEEEKEQSQSDNPLDQPAEVSWDSEIYQRPVVNNPYGSLDIVGSDGSILWTYETTKVTNTANEAFDPPPSMDDARLVLNITKNLASFDALQALAYTNAVNSDPWNGFPARVARCMRFSGNRQSEKGITFWAVNYQFQFRFETWDYDVLNQGYMHRSEPSAVPMPYVDPLTGQKPSAPVLLDADGVKIGPDDEPTYCRFRVYRELPFSALSIL